MLLLRAFALHASCFSGQKNQRGVEGPRQPGKTCKSLKEGFTRVRRPLRGRVTNAHTSKGCSTCTTFSAFPPLPPIYGTSPLFCFFVFLFFFFLIFFILKSSKKEYRYYTFYMRVRFSHWSPGLLSLYVRKLFPNSYIFFHKKTKKSARVPLRQITQRSKYTFAEPPEVLCGPIPA